MLVFFQLFCFSFIFLPSPAGRTAPRFDGERIRSMMAAQGSSSCSAVTGAQSWVCSGKLEPGCFQRFFVFSSYFRRFGFKHRQHCAAGMCLSFDRDDHSENVLEAVELTWCKELHCCWFLLAGSCLALRGPSLPCMIKLPGSSNRPLRGLDSSGKAGLGC